MWLAAVLGCAHPVPPAPPAPAPATSSAEDVPLGHPDVVAWCVRGLVARASGDAAEQARAEGWLGVLGDLPGAPECLAALRAPSPPSAIEPAPARAEP